MTRIDVPPDLHRALKIEAAKRGMSMKDLVTEGLSSFLTKPPSGNVPQKPKGQKEKRLLCRGGPPVTGNRTLADDEEALTKIKAWWTEDPRSTSQADLAREVGYPYNTVDSWIRRNLRKDGEEKIDRSSSTSEKKEGPEN